MIVLDTNIASVVLLPDHPDLPIILGWQRTITDQDIRITAITRAEIVFGVARLPDGAMKRHLSWSIDTFLKRASDKTLPFGIREADEYGAIMAMRRSQGRPMGVLDAQIAAIAKVAGAHVATRNVRDFQGLDVP
ncbi:MAG: PIN domain-containing protein, partial [Propionibacteriaceae bacterium]|nr:PIN domain-containing protein [Propionibacteriaceae bacterium]